MHTLIVSPELVSTRSYLFTLVIFDLLYFIFTFIRFVILILLMNKDDDDDDDEVSTSRNIVVVTQSSD